MDCASTAGEALTALVRTGIRSRRPICALASAAWTYSGVPKAGAPLRMSTFEVKLPSTQGAPGRTSWQSAMIASPSAVCCASAPASVSNVATVAGGGDVNPANNSATDATTITQTPDLTIAKSHVGSFTQGQVGATYTITVTNAGAGPTTAAVMVADTLPASLTATAMSGTGWACVVGTVTCTRSDALAAGASYPAITLTVNVSLTAPASVTNIATVSGGGENNAANDSASDVTTVILTPDLTLAKTHAGVIVQGATGVLYTLVVTNVGAGPTVGTVTVVDTLPSALTATAIGGTGWTCTLATLTCTRADVLPAGASYPPITLTVNVAPTATGLITNTGAVAGGGDANPGNNSGSDSVNLAPPAPIDVPALSPWALFALAALLIMSGAMRARRRR